MNSTEEEIPERAEVLAILNHADAYANRCAEHAYCAAQAAASTAKYYAEFAQIAERNKVAGYAEFTKAAMYARYAASAAAEYANAAAHASTIYLARRAVTMPNNIMGAEDKDYIEALIKVANAAIELRRK